MSILEAIVLGAVQGLTELLPISSSGHLALVPALLGWDEPPLAFTVTVHVGTLVAICAYYRSDLGRLLTGCRRWAARRSASEEEGQQDREQARLVGLLLISTAPAATVGVLFRKAVASIFESPGMVGGFLVATGLLLWLAHRVSRRERGREAIRWTDAILIGCAQALALLPGISRSGTTIAAGMTAGLEAGTAVRFAFLMSIPVIMAGAVWEGLEIAQANLAPGEIGCYLIGAVVAAICGWMAIALVLRAVNRGKFGWFAVYCVVVGLIAMAADRFGS